jgi:hypothetical protein
MENDSYTVTFDFNYDGSTDAVSIKVDEGDKISEPDEIPTRLAYAVVGWYLETEGITKWNFASDNSLIVKY